MASTLGQTMQNAVLNWIKGTTFPATDANLYVALFTVTPSNTGGGTEVSGGGYARQAIASSGWSTISAVGETEQISNSAIVNFGTTSAAWGTVVAFAIFDASTSGNLIIWGALTNSKTINTTDTVQFAAGALVLNVN